MARPTEVSVSVDPNERKCIGLTSIRSEDSRPSANETNTNCDVRYSKSECEKKPDEENKAEGNKDEGEEEDYSDPCDRESEERELRRPLRSCRVRFADTMETSDNSVKNDINKDLSKLSRKGTGSVRYNQPRLSLLGRPINYKFHKRDLRYRRIQSRIYNFLERPKVWYAFLYHVIVFLVCVGCLVLSTLSTISQFEPMMSTTVMFIEPVILLWLMLEYVFRIWASGCRSRYQGWSGRLKFAQRPLCIVDLVIVLASLLVILVGTTTQVFAASTLRGLRFFQILRMVRVDRRAGTWKLLASVVWAHRQELVTTLYIGFLGLLFSSFLVYLAEKDHDPERFGTFADALWWGVVTLCTVGYGDVVPGTWAGKCIAAFSAVLGISFFALPAGILGSGFALKVQQQQRQKHLIRRRVPAALLIQSLWRCYAADENSMSLATWKPHMVPCPSPTQDRPFKNNTSFVSRFSTKRKDRGANSSSGNISPHSPLISRSDSKKNGGTNSEDEIPDTLHSKTSRKSKTRSHLSLATGLVDQRVDRIAVMKEASLSSFHLSEEELDVSPKARELTEVHKTAIRSLRKIKYFVARKKFREALRPYDVKDVIEQYSAGHVDMLGRVKSLQCRIDQILGKAGSKNKDVYDSKVSLSSRVVKVERQVEDIESKLDLLIDLYKEDRKILLQKAKPPAQSEPSSDNTGCDPSILKPRSILVDKQFTSEPSSPIVKHPKKVMQRNHSDLSNRIRKRVTYRLHSSPIGNMTGIYSSPIENSFIPENTIPRSQSDPYSSQPSYCPDKSYSPCVSIDSDIESGNKRPSQLTMEEGNCSGKGTDSEQESRTQPSQSKRHRSPTSVLRDNDSHPSYSDSPLADISFCDPITPESPENKMADFGRYSPRFERKRKPENGTDSINSQEFQTITSFNREPFQDNDQTVLLPRGSMEALKSDTSEV